MKRNEDEGDKLKFNAKYTPPTRRQFLGLMTIASASASLAGCPETVDTDANQTEAEPTSTIVVTTEGDSNRPRTIPDIVSTGAIIRGEFQRDDSHWYEFKLEDEKGITIELTGGNGQEYSAILYGRLY